MRSWAVVRRAIGLQTFAETHDIVCLEPDLLVKLNHRSIRAAQFPPSEAKGERQASVAALRRPPESQIGRKMKVNNRIVLPLFTVSR
jgi:hypothetical protein